MRSHAAQRLLRLLAVAALGTTIPGGSHAAPPSEEAPTAEALGGDPATTPPEFEWDGPPADPDDTPFMRAPRGQQGNFSGNNPDAIRRGFEERRRLQLTILPLYAALRLPFRGRTRDSDCELDPFECEPIRGGGASLELDVRLLDWLWARVQTTHTIHPVDQELAFDEESEETVVRANEGNINVTTGGVGLVYALDLGRLLPMVDFGVGAAWIQTPLAAQRGQYLAECRDDGSCDVGLSCSADTICRPSMVPMIHAGVGMDVLLGKRWSLGVHVRYHAMVGQGAVFPVYAMGAARLAIRF